MDELENGDTGSLLETAQKFVDDFQESKIDFECPNVHGYMFCKSAKSTFASRKLRYFLLQVNTGVLVKMKDMDYYLQIAKDKPDYFNMTEKQQKNSKVSVVKLSVITSIHPCDKAEFKKKNQHVLLLSYDKEEAYLIFNDAENMN